MAKDDTKGAAVMNWLTPKTIKDLQHFLGFASFCSKFIQGFSSTANPLTTLLKKATQLKTAFTIAPILKHPDPFMLYMVKVNASESGVGAVLSQHFWEKSKLHLFSILL